MKKALSLLLVLSCLATLLVVPAQGMDEATIQKAVIETAVAFYNKDTYVQYDSSEMNRQERMAYGMSRSNALEPPENAAADYTYFDVCSLFCFNVYYNAFGYKLNKSDRTVATFDLLDDFPAGHPMVVCKYGQYRDDVHTKDKDEYRKMALEKVKPGDVLVYYHRGPKGELQGGHAMLYLGDYKGDGKNWIMHSAGSKVSLTTGVDSYEVSGSIRTDIYEDFLLDPANTTSGYSLYFPKCTEFVILRPWLDPEFPKDMTPSAKTRLKYTGMDVDRSSNINWYNDVQTGQELTITTTVKNLGTAAYQNLVIKEVAPKGASIVAGSASAGGKTDGTGLTWTANIPVGGEFKASYKVKITAKRGETVDLPCGTVDALPSRALTYKVGGQPIDPAPLAQMAKDGRIASIRTGLRSQTDFANAFYEAVYGIKLGLPKKLNTLLNDMFALEDFPGVSNIYGGQLWTLKDEKDMGAGGKLVMSMILPDHISGLLVHSAPQIPDSMNAAGRAKEFKEIFYRPGDIFIALQTGTNHKAVSNDDVLVYIYLGDGKVALSTEKGAEVKLFQNTVANLFNKNVILALRPSLAQDNINTQIKKPAVFTDVPAGAWYLPYVSALSLADVVEGGKFRPNDMLTVGEALEMLCKAAGTGVQKPTGAHKASGYLTKAIAKGWVVSEMDLNARITRLQFAQIAASAMGVGGQPKVNPFADTKDFSALALYNAGVMKGVSLVSFRPDGFLPRSRAAQIICGLMLG